MIFHNCAIIFEVNVVAAKTSLIGNDFFVFYKFPTLNFFPAPLPYHCSGVPA